MTLPRHAVEGEAMNGWKRLWIVLSVLWVLPMCFFLIMAASNILEAGKIKYIVDVDPLLELVDPLETVFKRPAAKGWRWADEIPIKWNDLVDTSDEVWIFSDRQTVNHVPGSDPLQASIAQGVVLGMAEDQGKREGFKYRESAQKRAWEGFYFASALVFAPPAILYVLGLAVGWVWRGFRPPETEF